ncbi:MAG: hypothetical protein HZB53_05405 [Chloroflexi bacterium]|nr:hypothetical protein [Chloroflexota bacterium]
MHQSMLERIQRLSGVALVVLGLLSALVIIYGTVSLDLKPVDSTAPTSRKYASRIAELRSALGVNLEDGLCDAQSGCSAYLPGNTITLTVAEFVNKVGSPTLVIGHNLPGARVETYRVHLYYIQLGLEAIFDRRADGKLEMTPDMTFIEVWFYDAHTLDEMKRAMDKDYQGFWLEIARRWTGFGPIPFLIR